MNQCLDKEVWLNIIFLLFKESFTRFQLHFFFFFFFFLKFYKPEKIKSQSTLSKALRKYKDIRGRRLSSLFDTANMSQIVERVSVKYSIFSFT